MHLQRNVLLYHCQFLIIDKFQSIQIGSDSSSAVSGQQSVSVNNDNNVANVDNNNGWNSWNTLLDYGTVGSQYAISIPYKCDAPFLTTTKRMLAIKELK